MSAIVAKRLVEHLERAGFVIMKRPPIAGVGGILVLTIRATRFRVGFSSHSRSDRVSSFRGLPQIAPAPMQSRLV
jgi:hypothetical protein